MSDSVLIRKVTPEQSDLLKKIAKEKHMSVNGLLLTLIDQYIKKNKSE